MKKNLMNFSSISPIQMLGKKKVFTEYEPSKNLFNTEKYEVVDNKIAKSLKSNLAKIRASLTFPVVCGATGVALGELINNTNALPINPTFIFLVNFSAFGAIIALDEIFIDKYNLSANLYNVALNSALYPILLPAKLVAKAKMHKEIKLAKTDEGRKALYNRYNLPVEIKKQKNELRQREIENNFLKLANKELKSQQNLFETLKKFENENIKIQNQNAELKNENEQMEIARK